MTDKQKEIEVQAKLIVSQIEDRFETKIIIEINGEDMALFVIGISDSEDEAFRKGCEAQEQMSVIWRE